MSTSRDDTLRIWDAKQDLQQLAVRKHYNNTGRWVVPFRAVWGPASDTVICGSMKRTVLHHIYLSPAAIAVMGTWTVIESHSHAEHLVMWCKPPDAS